MTGAARGALWAVAGMLASVPGGPARAGRAARRPTGWWWRARPTPSAWTRRAPATSNRWRSPNRCTAGWCGSLRGASSRRRIWRPAGRSAPTEPSGPSSCGPTSGSTTARRSTRTRSCSRSSGRSCPNTRRTRPTSSGRARTTTSGTSAPPRRCASSSRSIDRTRRFSPTWRWARRRSCRRRRCASGSATSGGTRWAPGPTASSNGSRAIASRWNATPSTGTNARTHATWC